MGSCGERTLLVLGNYMCKIYFFQTYQCCIFDNIQILHESLDSLDYKMLLYCPLYDACFVSTTQYFIV